MRRRVDFVLARVVSLAASISLGVVSLGSVGCGGAPTVESGFAPGWQWDRGADAERLLTELRAKKAPARVAVAVGVTGHGLVGRRLPDGARWTYEGNVDVLPSIVGDLVAFSGDGKVTGLDVTTGQKRFQFESEGRRLEGMGHDGDSSILLLVDGDDARPDRIAMVNRHGQVRVSTSTLERVGTPAAIGGIGFVPWASQYVSAFHLGTGEPLGRILVRDATNRVETRDGDVYFYGRGVSRLTAELARDPEWPSLRVPKLDFPGEPSWPVDGSKPRPAKAHSVGYHGYPVPDGARLRFADDTFLATYFDVAVGLDAAEGAVRWTTHFERSVIGADAGRYGFVTCLEDGSLWFLRVEDGGASPAGSLEGRLRACVVVAPDTRSGTPRSAPVEAQIHEVVTTTGPSMAAVHAFLVDRLGKRAGEGATTTLLGIARDPLTSPPVVERASRALERRSDGAEAMLAALEETAPPLPPPRKLAEPKSEAPAEALRKAPAPKAGASEMASASLAAPAAAPSPEPDEATRRRLETRRPPRRPPPLLALARALTAMNERRAAPLLARHLLAPSLPVRDAEAIISAVMALGGAAETPLLLEFFLSYRTVGGEPDFVEALGHAGDFVWRNGSPEEKAEIDRAARDPLTHPDVAKSLIAKLKVKKKKKPVPAKPAPPEAPADAGSATPPSAELPASAAPASAKPKP